MSEMPLPPPPELKPGLYRHYKGGLYTVLGVARHSESLDPMVVYRAEYGESGLWIRPYGMFVEEVYHNGVATPRFAPVSDEEPVAVSLSLASETPGLTEEPQHMNDSTPPPIHSLPDSGLPPDSERTLATLAHALAIIAPFLAPLIIWLIEKEKNNFAAQEALEALNFSITLMIVSFGLMICVFIPVIGCLAIPLIIGLSIGSLVCHILAAMQVSKGIGYRYPVNFRFIR